MKPNVIFVLLDGARWDRVNISNDFMELIKEGTFFNNVTTSAPYTFASMNAIFTGHHGKENGVDAYYKMFRLKESMPFLPEILQKNGYFTSCDLITNKVVSTRGFDIYQSHNEYEDDLTIRHPLLLETSFAKSEKKPIFSFLQYSQIHKVTVSEILKKYEWNNREFYSQKDANMKVYDEVFINTCKYAKKIYEKITEMNRLNDTIIVFFSDHGTGIGERFGERNYGVYLYEETLRTFYLLIGPGIKKDRKCNILLSTIDILPTILQLCGIVSDVKLPGKSFASYVKDGDNEINKFVFSATGGLQGPFPSPDKPNVFGIKTKQYKLIYFKDAAKWELYDLKNDPSETNDLQGKKLPIESELKEELVKWINR